MKNILKKNKLSAIVFSVYILLLMVRKDMAISAFDNSTYYLVEMAQILPVIFMLTVAIDVLIPKEWIVKRLGKESRIAGMTLALAFGSLSAGPIYAAFPIAKTLHKKGASVGNVVVILSAWAVIKVPMLANEAKFLSIDFMAVRWLLTVMFIIGIGLLMEKMHINVQDETDSERPVVAVKKEYCVGCTVCEKMVPEIFKMQDGKAVVIASDILPELLDETFKERLYNISRKCPSKAIEVNVNFSETILQEAVD